MGIPDVEPGCPTSEQQREEAAAAKTVHSALTPGWTPRAARIRASFCILPILPVAPAWAHLADTMKYLLRMNKIYMQLAINDSQPSLPVFRELSLTASLSGTIAWRSALGHPRNKELSGLDEGTQGGWSHLPSPHAHCQNFPQFREESEAEEEDSAV
ncbi:uncharacterized protein LOC143646594 isoform X2 [Tamandua tetradactyla]|uniref:uncharacterized protein LOC143646594 isoform X2 n=1 Tax=Tamandua tetradactyla TaxID=48850 RepID=UPI004053B2F6